MTNISQDELNTFCRGDNLSFQKVHTMSGTTLFEVVNGFYNSGSLALSETNDVLNVEGIFLYEAGTRLGTKVLETLKQYALKKGSSLIRIKDIKTDADDFTGIVFEERVEIFERIGKRIGAEVIKSNDSETRKLSIFYKLQGN
ncbi:MAG: hypothetical protein JW791_02840 [Nanoarchaeota archaeon]|nr:hypothetical protein [Nanoarchaeota archaeon]